MPENTQDAASAQASTTDPTTAQAPGATPAADPSDALGAPGLKALQDERTARKELERQLSQMRSALASLGGEQVDPSKSSVDDIVRGLADEVNGLKRENDALAVLNRFHIVDETDTALIKSQPDAAAMATLAARLAPAAGDQQSSGQPRTPAPDPTQGGGAGATIPLNGDGLEAALRAAVGA